MNQNVKKPRTCLVTGGTSGVGLAIATALARNGDRVVITSRSQEPANSAAASIAAETGSETVTARRLNLADPTDVKSFASEFQDSHDSLHGGFHPLEGRADPDSGPLLAPATERLRQAGEPGRGVRRGARRGDADDDTDPTPGIVGSLVC